MANLNNILALAESYDYIANFIKIAVIRKLPNGKYQVQSHKGKNLGTYKTKSEAEKRLKQVEYFKHVDNSNVEDCIDLTDIDDFSYSAIMRKLRQKCDNQVVRDFLHIYKKQFDKLIKNNSKNPEKVALEKAVINFNKIHKIKINMEKTAAVEGDPVLVGKYMSNIIKFTLSRISDEKRPNAINSLKQKIYNMNENEIANKNMPASSAIGQALTFTKHVLFNGNPRYIREVLNNIVKNL